MTLYCCAPEMDKTNQFMKPGNYAVGKYVYAGHGRGRGWGRGRGSCGGGGGCGRGGWFSVKEMSKDSS